MLSFYRLALLNNFYIWRLISWQLFLSRLPRVFLYGILTIPSILPVFLSTHQRVLNNLVYGKMPVHGLAFLVFGVQVPSWLTCADQVLRGNKAMSIFTGDLNPNYNRKPKTLHFCDNCQKDIKEGSRWFLAYVRGDYYIPFEDAISTDKKAVLGYECARKLPRNYRKEIKVL